MISKILNILLPNTNKQPIQKSEIIHVDDWLDEPTLLKINNRDNVIYAKFVLEFYRMPAWKQNDFKQYTQQFQLFCTYKNERWKVTGASRLGDIWLTKDFSKTSGYELRVDLNDCSEWGENP